MNSKDHVFYDGPSVLTGDRVIGVTTGLSIGSANRKTGEMAQAWILRADMPPMDAKRKNLDDAICGDCSMRGEGGFGASCYVTPWLGPNNVWKKWSVGGYENAHRSSTEIPVRLGAYGDPAAIPFHVWDTYLHGSAGWIGYTHQWVTCDQEFRRMLMASVDNSCEMSLAQSYGWRTFRVRGKNDPIGVCEFVCPASNESGHRTTCRECLLCAGTSSPARSVVIMAHGKPGNMAAFYKSRDHISA